MAHRTAKVGDVLQFSLPDGTYAYGRKLRDSSVAFYAETSSESGHPPIGSTDFQFCVSVYSDVLRSDEVPIVGFDPQVYNGDDWPRPNAIIDLITGANKIYDHGEIRPAKEGEHIGLERAAVWGLNHVIDRLMGLGDLWLRGFPQGPISEMKREGLI